MKKFVIILLVLPIVATLILVFSKMRWKFSKPANPPPVSEQVSSDVTSERIPAAALNSSGATNGLLGETILRDYANTNLPPEHDLTLMAHLMENSLLLLKSAANRPLSANEDWADLFRGRNGAHEEFLSTNSIALNEQGQLVDRWKTPLFFHALGNGRYDVRSAGPDKMMWTADDLQRGYDGMFLRGTNAATKPGRTIK